MKSVCENFMEKNNALLNGVSIERALYLRNNCTEIIVLQCNYKNKKCFIFEHDCGVLNAIKSEFDSMEKYMMLIPNSEYAEYITF